MPEAALESSEIADGVPLAIAAQQLRQSYQATWTQLLTGRLEGSKTRRGWRVSRASLEAALRRKREATAGAA